MYYFYFLPPLYMQCRRCKQKQLKRTKYSVIEWIMNLNKSLIKQKKTAQSAAE